jgi:hypothetical protein
MYICMYYMLGCMLYYIAIDSMVHSLQHVLQELTPAHPFKPSTEPPVALH